jgi:hypothetical protein
MIEYGGFPGHWLHRPMFCIQRKRHKVNVHRHSQRYRFPTMKQSFPISNLGCVFACILPVFDVSRCKGGDFSIFKSGKYIL